MCTQMGCTNGVILRSDDSMFAEHGLYKFQFFLDKEQVECKGRLPLPPCGPEKAITCTKPSVMITESGCALAESEHKIGDIFIFGTPRKITMIATHNDTTILVRTIRPSYVFARPNGPGCEPECVTSTISLGPQN